MRCTNEHFLSGCNFDRAYTNPCSVKRFEASPKLLKKGEEEEEREDKQATVVGSEPDFNQRQQMKLRSIAAGSNLLDLIVERTLLAGASQTISPAGSAIQSRQVQDQTLLYLLIAIISVIVLLALILVAFMCGCPERETGGQGQVVATPRSANYMNNQQLNRNRHHLQANGRPNIKTIPGPISVVVTKGRSRHTGKIIDNSVL